VWQDSLRDHGWIEGKNLPREHFGKWIATVNQAHRTQRVIERTCQNLNCVRPSLAVSQQAPDRHRLIPIARAEL